MLKELESYGVVNPSINCVVFIGTEILPVYVLICSGMFKFHRNGCVHLSVQTHPHLLNPLEQNVPVLWDTELCTERLLFNMSRSTENVKALGKQKP